MSSTNPICPKTPTPPQSSGTPSVKDVTLERDQPCVNNNNVDETKSKMGTPRGAAGDSGDANLHKAEQTRSDVGSNVENPNSCTQAQTPRSESGACFDEQQRLAESRNPITGLGLNGDGVGGWKPKKQKQREGNPVTGEGYTGPVNVPGVHPVINKNRVPPGGFSSGLW